MDEFVKNFRASAISDNLSMLVGDLPDKAFQALIYGNEVEELVKEIPIIEYVFKAGKAISAIKEYRLAKKIYYFLFGIRDISTAERYRIIGELCEISDEDAGEVLLDILDRIDNINKVSIISNLLKARIVDNISIEDFLRLSSALIHIPYIDLKRLILYIENNYEAGSTEILYASGVLKITVINSYKGGKYSLGEMGIKLLRYGMRAEFDDSKCKKEGIFLYGTIYD